MYNINIDNSPAVISTVGSTLAPHSLLSQIVGFNEQTDEIWLIGGYNDEARESYVSSFNRTDESFTDYTSTIGTDELGDRARAYCWGQCYTQIGDYIYWINHFNNKNDRRGYGAFNRWTLSNSVYEEGWNSVNVPSFGMSSYSCLTSLDIGDGYLIVTAHDVNAGIYDIGAAEWMANVPTMNIRRTQHACAVNPRTRKVYVMGGGASEESITDTIEELQMDVTDMSGTSWRLWDEALLNPVIAHKGLRAIFHRGYIYVVGGSDIQLIDVDTESVSIYGELTIPVYNAAVIKIQQRIYTFGGEIVESSSYTRNWQYFSLPSESAAESVIVNSISGNHVEEEYRNDFDRNSTGLSNKQLFLTLVFGNIFIILGSVAIGICIGRRMQQQPQKYENINISETEAL